MRDQYKDRATMTNSNGDKGVHKDYYSVMGKGAWRHSDDGACENGFACPTSNTDKE